MQHRRELQYGRIARGHEVSMGDRQFFRLACLSFVMSIGCGGAQQESIDRQYEPAVPSAPSPAQMIEVPETTSIAMKSCVENVSHSWDARTHAFQYRLGTNERGKVLGVTLQDATIRDSSLEACFERALATMSVPEDALRLRSSKPFSGGEHATVSRGNVGVVQAAAAPIALAPILIPAIGVTIIVAISLDIIRKATSAPDCKEVKQDCIRACEGKLPTGDYGFRFWNCVNACMRTAGC